MKHTDVIVASVTAAILIAPVVVASITVPCTGIQGCLVLFLVPAVSFAAYVAYRAAKVRRRDLPFWLAVGLLFNCWWLAQSFLTSTPLRMPIELHRPGAVVTARVWRFWPGSTYILRMRLHDPVGRNMVRVAGDPRNEIWFNEPPLVDISILSPQGTDVVRFSGELSRTSLCSGYRECDTSRDDLLFDCASMKFFSPNSQGRHTVTVTTIRASPHAPIFDPRLEIVAMRDWDPFICVAEATALAVIFSLFMIVRTRSSRWQDQQPGK